MSMEWCHDFVRDKQAKGQICPDVDPVEFCGLFEKHNNPAPSCPALDEKIRSCTAQVRKTLSKGCLARKAWGLEVRGKMCYNPFAVCNAALRDKKVVAATCGG